MQSNMKRMVASEGDETIEEIEAIEEITGAIEETTEATEGTTEATIAAPATRTQRANNFEARPKRSGSHWIGGVSC